jgi:hypothetical protein
MPQQTNLLLPKLKLWETHDLRTASYHVRLKMLGTQESPEQNFLYALLEIPVPLFQLHQQP